MAVKRYMPLAALTVWSAILAWLIMDGNYQQFLTPSFKGLILTSLVIAPALAAGLVFTGLPRQNLSWLKGLILILPVGFILLAGDNTLGEYALRKRGLAPPDLGGTESAPADPADVTDADGNISISQLVMQFERFEGQQVQIEGLFADQVAEHDELSAVYRYLITCCAADAQPVGVFIDYNPELDLKNNDWVRVSGRVNQKTLDGYQVIFMAVDEIKGVEKPDKNAAYIY